MRPLICHRQRGLAAASSSSNSADNQSIDRYRRRPFATSPSSRIVLGWMEPKKGVGGGLGSSSKGQPPTFKTPRRTKSAPARASGAARR